MNKLSNILSSTKFLFGVSIFCLIMTFISAIGFLLVPNSVNFLDGLNTLAIGYLSIILLVIVKLNYFGYLNLDVNKIYFIILFFIFIFFCN